MARYQKSSSCCSVQIRMKEAPDADYYYKAKRTEFKCCFRSLFLSYRGENHLKPTAIHQQVTGASDSFRISDVSSISEVSSITEEDSDSFRNSGAPSIDGNRLCLANAPFNGDNWAIVSNNAINQEVDKYK